MRRSVENAAHVGELRDSHPVRGEVGLTVRTGLFAPRAGQSFRDEQRRRRSQYDRGTRLAEIEDAFDDGNRPYRYQPNAFHAGSPYGGFNDGFNASHYPGFGSPL